MSGAFFMIMDITVYNPASFLTCVKFNIYVTDLAMMYFIPFHSPINIDTIRGVINVILLHSFDIFAVIDFSQNFYPGIPILDNVEGAGVTVLSSCVPLIIQFVSRKPSFNSIASTANIDVISAIADDLVYEASNGGDIFNLEHLLVVDELFVSISSVSLSSIVN